MQISKGVEWACHAAILMAALPKDKALKADALARFHELPAAYMAKQLQAMSKAGLVISSRGARGGYRLAKAPAEINLWDITAAIEGHKHAFRCSEIRQKGPCAVKKIHCKTPCSIAASFWAAETAFREALQKTSLVQIMIGVAETQLSDDFKKLADWIEKEAV